MTDLAASIDRLEAGGTGVLMQLINEGTFGRGGMSGHHIVYGHEVYGMGPTLDDAVADWLAEAKGWGTASQQKEMAL